MNDITIRVKNYRCFEDQRPAELKLGAGFTAFVGVNNSGKSALLKMLHELKQLWNSLAPGQDMTRLISPNEITIDYIDIYDMSEIFSDNNSRPITIEVEIQANPSPFGGKDYINLVKFECDRKRPLVWKITSTTASTGLTIHNIALPLDVVHDKGFRLTNGTEIAAQPIRDAMFLLAHSLYIGPFRNAINDGAADYFGLKTGTAFIDMWLQWKTGADKNQNRRLDAVTDDIRRMFRFDQLEINASQQLKTLSLSINDKPYKLREVGAGLSQFIIVLGNAAISEPTMILVDEPELNLHPTLQIDFLTSLASYSKAGTVFATHSIGLARSTAEKIYAFQRKGKRVEVRPLEQVPDYPEFVGELGFSTFREMGYNCLLAVEGVTEVKTIQQFLRKLRKDHEVVILPLGGSQLINGRVSHELEELKRLTQNVSILIDSERKAAREELDHDRKEFVEKCTALGYNVYVTELRATENYFSDRAIKQVKGDNYRALQKFERLKDCNPAWDKAENWKIAREMRLDEIESTDLGKFLADIKTSSVVSTPMMDDGRDDQQVSAK